MKIVSASALYKGGDLCPICGREKEKGVVFCSSCWKPELMEEIYAIERAQRLIDLANERLASRRKAVSKKPVLSLFRISQNARWHKEIKEVPVSYLETSFSIPDPLGEGIGSLPVFVFGVNQNDAGRTISVLAELKKKMARVNGEKRGIKYLRLQKVDFHNLRPDVCLHITVHKDARELFVPGLPQLALTDFFDYKNPHKEQFKKFLMGFIKA